MTSDLYVNGFCDGKVCDSRVFNARTLPECKSKSEHTYDMYGRLIAKVPILIAEPKIEIDVEADIKLDEPAVEIKRIKKNLFLTQCKLLSMDKDKKGKLFIGGFIRKNIEYATIIGQSPMYYNYGLCGDIRHTTVKIPFECVAEIDFICPPEFFENSFTKEIEIFSHMVSPCNPCEEKILGSDVCEQQFKHFERFSEKIMCELVDVNIIEADIRKNPVMMCSQMPNEQLFDCMVEKMVICIKLKLLQNQQIKVQKTDCLNYRRGCGCRRR
jgi:hypothetical protein